MASLIDQLEAARERVTATEATNAQLRRMVDQLRQSLRSVERELATAKADAAKYQADWLRERYGARPMKRWNKP